MAKDSHERAQRRSREAIKFLDRRQISWRYATSDVAFECRRNDLTQEEFFRLQEKYTQEDFKYAKKHLDDSRWGGGGKKGYKKPYRRLSRRQGKKICQAYLEGDEHTAESITQEGFMGEMGWDIW